MRALDSRQPSSPISYLERMVNMITQAGGDVLKFAGDALLCLFLPDSGTVDPKGPELATMVHRAAQVCLSSSIVFSLVKLYT